MTVFNALSLWLQTMLMTQLLFIFTIWNCYPLTKPNSAGHHFCSFMHSEYVSHRKGMIHLSYGQFTFQKGQRNGIILSSLLNVNWTPTGYLTPELGQMLHTPQKKTLFIPCSYTSAVSKYDNQVIFCYGIGPLPRNHKISTIHIYFWLF